MDVAYLCDHLQCPDCSYPNCDHTTDITHARNFVSVGGGVLAETERKEQKPTKENIMSHDLKNPCETCSHEDVCYYKYDIECFLKNINDYLSTAMHTEIFNIDVGCKHYREDTPTPKG